MLSLWDNQKNLFLCSDDFLYDEKCYNATKEQSISALSRQTTTYFILVMIQNNMLILFKKEAKNNFKDVENDPDGFGQDGFDEKAHDRQCYDRDRPKKEGLNRKKRIW